MMPSTSASKVDTSEINDYVREYLRYSGFTNTLEALDLDIKAKATVAKAGKKEPARGEEQPRLFAFFRNDGAAGKTRKELNAEKEHKEFQKKYNLVLQAARQIFSVSVNCLQLLHSMKETSKNENLSETLENYKIQLGKYHKIIINEGKPEGMELITETVMAEHKAKFLKYFNEKNIDGLIEVLLSLRVNALQIAPELRKNLVYELIRNDIFNIDVTDSFSLLSSILDINNQSLKHAITSLISVVASTLKGVEYLTSNGDTIIIEKVIKIMKEQENGSVTQRFCIAIIQKASVKESIIPTFVDAKMIDWVINLMNKSLHTKIHVFCLDFASAMLANIIHAPSTLQYLEANASLALQVIESLLRLVRENVPVSVLMHILICLSYLSKENFQAQIEECQFVDRISEFVEYYSQINTADNEALEIDKKTVLDLCAHMFHPKDNTNEGNDTVEMNELKTEDRIREYENEQGELIFECFQDEVS